MKKRLVLIAALVVLPLAAVAHDTKNGHDHSHADFSAGEPGDPKKPAKIVQVELSEKDGKMLFAPGRLEVKKGDQIKFVLRNSGELEHEFVLGTTTENLEHAEEMKKKPEMAHDEPNGKRLRAKESGEMIWRFTKAGEFEYACLIPGHRESGMVGVVAVK